MANWSCQLLHTGHQGIKPKCSLMKVHIGFIGYFSLEALLSRPGNAGEGLFCVTAMQMAIILAILGDTVTKMSEGISFMKEKFVCCSRFWRFWRKGMTQESHLPHRSQEGARDKKEPSGACPQSILISVRSEILIVTTSTKLLSTHRLVTRLGLS